MIIRDVLMINFIIKPQLVKGWIKMDERAQLSAEMIMLIGAILIIVIVAGIFIGNIAGSVASDITDTIDIARDNTIGRM